MMTKDEIRIGAKVSYATYNLTANFRGKQVHALVGYKNRRLATIQVLDDHNGWRRPSYLTNFLGWGNLARHLNEGLVYDFQEE